MKRETRDIKNKILALYDFVKQTDLSYPNRASILGFLGAALVANIAATDVLPYHEDAELRAHLHDALKPLGFMVKRAPGHHAPKYMDRALTRQPRHVHPTGADLHP